MDLNSEIFSASARRAIDWIIHYFEHTDEYPVLSRVKPGEIKSQLPELPPTLSESFDTILDDFEKIIIPGITHWNHPRFFAYFSITGSYPGIIGEFLSSALNVNAMNWKSSPSATELEEVVLEWFRYMVQLPTTFMGIINDTASVSSLCAIAAAREATAFNIRELGLSGRPDLPQLILYVSEETHSSIERAAMVLGIGQNNVRKISTDAVFRMNTDELEQRIRVDIDNGCKPIGVVATIGTTSTTSIDPVAEIASICRKYNLWLHVDAAYGGPVSILPEKRDYFVGWELADSIVINPHKWMFTPIDCSVLFSRRPDMLKSAFSLVPEYLRTAEQDVVKNYMDYGVALGRRFRALKLWMIIRSYGTNKIQKTLREHLNYAEKFKAKVEEHDDFELMAPVPFSTVVFRLNPNHGKHSLSNDELNSVNERLMNKINATGEVFLSHTKLRGNFSIRLAIGNIKTIEADIDLAWDIILKQAKEFCS
ncbi:aminotransferase class V-fold PLP-dependent enzyme [candidate division KSB1 bacterium]|nr:aminotransferase class V-fold PLP-dependent enzyme [candidate division KSB1 bacterium]